jgi:hypothetical protein
MEYAKIRPLRFDEQKCSFWSKRMQFFLQEHGFYVYQSVVDGYVSPTTPQLKKERNSTKTNQKIKEPF